MLKEPVRDNPALYSSPDTGGNPRQRETGKQQGRLAPARLDVLVWNSAKI
jgi:hypothetical protein